MIIIKMVIIFLQKIIIYSMNSRFINSFIWLFFFFKFPFWRLEHVKLTVSEDNRVYAATETSTRSVTAAAAVATVATVVSVSAVDVLGPAITAATMAAAADINNSDNDNDNDVTIFSSFVLQWN